MKLFICEKPSQAADVAKAIGNARRGANEWHTSDGVVTWAIGHLLETAPPDYYDVRYSKWDLHDLPIIPAEFHYLPKDKTKPQFKAIAGLLKQATEVIIATDADREGEMIGREILVACKFRGPVRRLWLSALVEASIRKALASIKPGAETINMYYEAKARAEADWIVGMNATRAATVTTQRAPKAPVISIGRVQTPTLALIVRRDREIESFVSKVFFDLVADVTASGGTLKMRHTPPTSARWYDPTEAERAVQFVKGLPTSVIHREEEEKRTPPPALFSLSLLSQRTSALWGWEADKTLEIAQALYATHKATTYPRTDCSFLSDEQRSEIPEVAAHLLAMPAFASLKGEAFKPRDSVFDNEKVTAHHAIIPSVEAAPWSAMDDDERKAYLLIASSYLASMLPDYQYRSVRYRAEFGGLEFAAAGNTPVAPGWKIAMSGVKKTEALDEADGDDEEATVPAVPNGASCTVQKVEIVTQKTKPLSRYTAGTLLKDMEGVAKYVTDPAKRARLREKSGLGTEATRPFIIKTLKDREYIEKKGGKLISTLVGRTLITRLEKIAPALADPGETAILEDALADIAKGKGRPDVFLKAVADAMRVHVVGFQQSSTVVPGASGAVGAPAGADGIVDFGDYYTHPDVRGRLYKCQHGHSFTMLEISRLVRGEELTVTDCTTRDGRPKGTHRVIYNGKLKPWPGLEFFPVEGGSGGGGGQSITPTPASPPSSPVAPKPFAKPNSSSPSPLRMLPQNNPPSGLGKRGRLLG
jgi:DNA topoisomerase-3